MDDHRPWWWIITRRSLTVSFGITWNIWNQKVYNANFVLPFFMWINFSLKFSGQFRIASSNGNLPEAGRIRFAGRFFKRFPKITQKPIVFYQNLALILDLRFWIRELKFKNLFANWNVRNLNGANTPFRSSWRSLSLNVQIENCSEALWQRASL